MNLKNEVENLIKSRYDIKLVYDLQIGEDGHSARGITLCQECESIASIRACSDVKGVWIVCPLCGLIDML
jgi:hypothetical protein